MYAFDLRFWHVLLGCRATTCHPYRRHFPLTEGKLRHIWGRRFYAKIFISEFSKKRFRTLYVTLFLSLWSRDVCLQCEVLACAARVSCDYMPPLPEHSPLAECELRHIWGRVFSRLVEIFLRKKKLVLSSRSGGLLSIEVSVYPLRPPCGPMVTVPAGDAHDVGSNPWPV